MLSVIFPTSMISLRPFCTHIHTHTLPDLRNTYVPQDQAPNRILRTWDLRTRIGKHTEIHVFPKVTSSNSNSSTLEPDRPQHDRAPSYVFSLHHSLPTFSLRFNSHKNKRQIFSRFRNVLFSFVYFLENFVRLKLRNINCVMSGSVCIRMPVYFLAPT
jgi:hypothetical protein